MGFLQRQVFKRLSFSVFVPSARITGMIQDIAALDDNGSHLILWVTAFSGKPQRQGHKTLHIGIMPWKRVLSMEVLR